MDDAGCTGKPKKHSGDRHRHFRHVGGLAAQSTPQRHRLRMRPSRRRPFQYRYGAEWRKVPIAVDTGFIVYNEQTYPNLTRSVRAISTCRRKRPDMSFAVSPGRRRAGIFGRQPLRLVRRKAQSVAAALLVDAARPAALLSRGAARPRAARAIPYYPRRLSRCRRLWRGVQARPPAADGGGDLVGANRARFSTIRPHRSSASRTVTACFRLRNRPQWRTVDGGSRAYVERLTRSYSDRIRLSAAVTGRAKQRRRTRQRPRSHADSVETFDHVVIATHADQALALLADPTRAGAAAARRLPLQPQRRGAACRSGIDAEAARGVVELEPYRAMTATTTSRRVRRSPIG